MKIRAVCLAAGEGKRMKSKLMKVLHPLCGRTMVEWVLRAVAGVDAQPILVVGHKREQVMAQVGERACYAVQEEQLGTGHAVMQAAELLDDSVDYVLVMAADMPLVREETIVELSNCAHEGADAVVLCAKMSDPTGYGRVLQNDLGLVTAIVEHRDADADQRAIDTINTSIYMFKRSWLLQALEHIGNDNDQREYYLTDAIAYIAGQGGRVQAMAIDAQEAMGINDRVQLAQAAQVLRLRIVEGHMRAGVTVLDPATAYIEGDVTIGQDAVIWPNNYLTGHTAIGEDCVLYPGNQLHDSSLGRGSKARGAVMDNAHAGEDCAIGPYAYMRPGSRVGDRVKIGDFVEVKNAVIGDDTKISHLTYVGDADVGRQVNLGCGVVFVNYDGVHKHRTCVGDQAFIGCNTNLVAPVTVGEGAYTAAGSTITQDVPAQSLGIARSRQTNKEGWISPKKKG